MAVTKSEVERRLSELATTEAEEWEKRIDEALNQQQSGDQPETILKGVPSSPRAIMLLTEKYAQAGWKIEFVPDPKGDHTRLS